MPAIDSDAHVVETERTWEFLEKSDEKYRPQLVQSPTDPKVQWWVIDNKIRGFRFPTLTEIEMDETSRRFGRNVKVPQAARGVDDVQLRLKHMDELGIDVQVLYNTLFIDQATDRASTEIALCWGWNRWMADVWKQSAGRLIWSCMPAGLSIPHALEQIRYSKENGAAAVTMRPIEGERLMFDPYFYPIYEEANRLNMAVGIHIANANPYLANLLSAPYDPLSSGVMRFRLWDVGACQGLLMSKLPDLFPNIRWGFIESAAQWVPWVQNECVQRAELDGERGPKITEDFWHDRRVFVTCQNNDDVSYIAKYCGDNALVIGTDYGHTDPSSEVDAIEVFKNRTDVEPALKQRILYDNAKELYGITNI